MRFLSISIERNQRRMNIEDILLLVLRCLLLILLALALARPAFDAASALHIGRSAVTGVIIIDNSASMGATDGVASRFQRARQYAETIIDAMPGSSSTAVLLGSDVVRGLIPEPTRDLNLARKILREAQLSDRGTSVLPALRQALETLSRRTGSRREIYLITDAQATGWSDLPEAIQLLQQNRKDIQAHIIIVNDPDPQNLGITGMRLASGLTPVDEPLRFEVQVGNFGSHDATAVSVRLGIDGEPASDQAVIDTIPAGATKSVSLFTKLRTEGFHAVTAELAGDRFAADDRRTLAVDATRRIRVLLVDGRPSREAREAETFYLRNALMPVDAASANEFYIEPVVITSGELATTRVDDYAAVVLANVSDLAQSTVVALDQYLQRGGGLIVFPGTALNARFYNDVAFMPAAFGPAREAEDEERAFRLQAKDYDHAITALWNDPAAGTLASARFMKALTLAPVTNAQTVVRFSDNSPAMVERTWGQGRVVVFASSASTGWNDLPVRPAFVPLLHRTLGALWAQKNKALNLPVGDRFFYRVTEDTLGKDAIISRGEKHRQFRRVELVDGRPVLFSEETDAAGAYDVAIQTEPPVKLKFATQSDPRESQLAPLTDTELTQLATAAEVVRWEPDAAWKQARQSAQAGREIWRALIFVAVLLALAETILGQKFSEPK